MERVARELPVLSSGPIAAVQDLLWALMDRDVVQGLLVPHQTHAHEAPAPTLIKNRERLKKTNPLAPVMVLNSAKIVGLLLAQASGKRLGAVLRPCEARVLAELSKQEQLPLEYLVTISIDCLGSHDEIDYQQRAALWGDDAPTHEALRWSRRGQIASYRFRQACQMCENPVYDDADITVGLFGQNIQENILVFAKGALAAEIGLTDDRWTDRARDERISSRYQTVERLVAQRRATRQRLAKDFQKRAAELADMLEIFRSCTLCGECQKACPLTAASDFEIDDFEINSQEYIVARLLDMARRSESCAGCGMCEAACHLGMPLVLVTRMLGERAQIRQDLLASFAEKRI